MTAPDKLATLYDVDQVLGFDLKQVDQQETLPEDIRRMADERLAARKAKNWALSDELRDKIQALGDAIQERGYLVQDTPQGTKVFKP